MRRRETRIGRAPPSAEWEGESAGPPVVPAERIESVGATTNAARGQSGHGEGRRFLVRGYASARRRGPRCSATPVVGDRAVAPTLVVIWWSDSRGGWNNRHDQTTRQSARRVLRASAEHDGPGRSADLRRATRER